MGVGAVEQVWSFITGAMDSITQFSSSRLYVDVHQTAGVRLAISVGLPLLVLAGVYYWFTLSPWSTKSSKSGLQLPPGNRWMLPLIGETLQLAVDVDYFVTSRVQRYGEVFSSHLFGGPTVVVTNVEAIKHVLASPNQKNFISLLPPTIRPHFGPQSVNQIPAGTLLHANLRRLFQGRTKAENVSGLISTVDDVVKATLNSWAERRTLKAYPELKKVAFHIALVLIYGEYTPGSEEMEICYKNFDNFLKGVTSLPINLPGTPLNKALKAVKIINDLTDRVMHKLKGTKADDHAIDADGLLGDLMNLSIPEEGITGLTRTQILDNVRVALNAAYEPSSAALTWLLKFLAENPDDLQEIIEEHKAIADSKGSKEYKLTYEDTLRMPASSRAFLETNRVVVPNFGVTRLVINDEELNGKLIPKGWTVIIPFRPTLHNPKYYPDPRKFNPSRFKTSPPQPGIFLPFGYGPRICPGGDLAKAQAHVFLHRLVLGYRWELLGNSNEVAVAPVPLPRGHLLIRVTRIEE
ncbi:unnamed protein product [Calypogeia fissa]